MSNALNCTGPQYAGFGVEVVRLQAGFVGQVFLGGRILWESKPFEKVDDAANAASGRIEKRLRKVFA